MSLVFSRMELSFALTFVVQMYDMMLALCGRSTEHTSEYSLDQLSVCSCWSVFCRTQGIIASEAEAVSCFAPTLFCDFQISVSSADCNTPDTSPSTSFVTYGPISRAASVAELPSACEVNVSG